MGKHVSDGKPSPLRIHFGCRFSFTYVVTEVSGNKFVLSGE